MSFQICVSEGLHSAVPPQGSAVESNQNVLPQSKCTTYCFRPAIAKDQRGQWLARSLTLRPWTWDFAESNEGFLPPSLLCSFGETNWTDQIAIWSAVQFWDFELSLQFKQFHITYLCYSVIPPKFSAISLQLHHPVYAFVTHLIIAIAPAEWLIPSTTMFVREGLKNHNDFDRDW